MSTNASFDIQHQIEKLERRKLDQYQPPATPVWGQLDATRFVRVYALARFWDPDDSTRFEQYLEDLITGLHGLQIVWAFLITGEKSQVRVHVGAQSSTLDAESLGALLQSSLGGAFPGIETALAEPRVGSVLNSSGLLRYSGRLSGVPALKSAPVAEQADEGQVQQIERLVRGLRGEEWGYFVFARPADPNSVSHLCQQHLEYIRQASALVKRSVQVGAGIQGEQTDRQAQYCVELLERNLQRLNRGKAQGMWQTESYFFAGNSLTLAKAQALLRSIYASGDSTLDPVRTLQCSPAAGTPPQHDPLLTLLNSRELATLTQLPREEFAGYALHDYAQFDVALGEIAATTEPAIPIGKIIDHGVTTNTPYVFPRSDLSKHALIVGVTGSGKTNTLFHLLHKVWDGGRGQPFLVIEPAKAEYRDLRTVKDLAALRVYTLGDERFAPFRLNPFEFEVGDGDQRIHVQTHIDYLKSVFNASFVLYAPMPYVLEQCLHEIYQDKGWDLTTSRNRRVPPKHAGNETIWNVFPTLTDLYLKIDEVTDRLGYEDRIKMDVKAGLKARVESLRLGGKGLLLDTPHSVAIDDLLAHPTVLELERIGDDEEKAFVMGLLMTRLYEFRVVQARRATSPPMQHVTVIEEAHRLLQNVSSQVSTESANVKGKSVETFANMLSEIRAYGEGVLIAEQIPTKLAPDAIKNTNLKILHRIVAQDDREIVGATMNLDEPQLRAIATLRQGQAAIYAEGNDHPFLVEVYPFKKTQIAGKLSDDAVRAAMSQICLKPEFDSQTRDAAFAVMAQPQFSQVFTRYVLSLLNDRSFVVRGYVELRRLTAQTVRAKNPEAQQIARCLMTEAITRWFEDKGRRYMWFYNATDTARQQLLEIALHVVAGFENNADVLARLTASVAPLVGQFQASYLSLCSNAPIPYEGCAECRAKCVYRYDVLRLTLDGGLRQEFVGAIQAAKDDEEMWRRLGTSASQVGKRLVAVSDPTASNGAALCYAVQMGVQLGFNRASQGKMVKNIKVVLGALG